MKDELNEHLVTAVHHLHAAVATLVGLLPAGHAADKSLQMAAVALRKMADEQEKEPAKAAKEEAAGKKR